MFRITEVVKYLLIINVALFIIGAINLFDTSSLALYYFKSPEFRPWQVVTHFFMHAGTMHLFFNMFALVMFGSALETRWGPKRFLFFYIFCALGAAALHTGYNYFDLNRQEKAIVSYEESPSFDGAFLYVKRFAPKYLKRQYISAKEYLEDVADKIDDGDPRYIEEGKKVMLDIYQYNRDIPTVGASGAIYGLLLAFGMMFPNAELMLLFLPIPIKAKYFIPLLMVGELFLGVNQFSWDNIAHFAHLGGALFGLILILYWQKYGSRLGGV